MNPFSVCPPKHQSQHTASQPGNARHSRSGSGAALLALQLAGCLLLCAGQQDARAATYKAPPATLAAAKALEIQPGMWEIRRIDVRNATPAKQCITQRDWEKTRARATGKSPAPPGCQITEVAVLAKTLRTTYSCKDKLSVEEIEFSGAAFRRAQFDTPKGANKSTRVKEEAGRLLGPCDGKK